LFVDPVPLNEKPLQDLVRGNPIAGVFVTNINHCRAATEFSERLSVPIFAHERVQNACGLRSMRCVTDSEIFAKEIRAIEIPGAPTGEMAIHQASDAGSLVVGDALINFEPYGFTFLPPKYCLDAKKMRRSLRRLLDYEFERILFAHGTPLLHSARKKLEQLLRDGD
jgi:glyoxylase-like metal-dependent hydrolase (beta-lactamase superfamily II)